MRTAFRVLFMVLAPVGIAAAIPFLPDFFPADDAAESLRMPENQAAPAMVATVPSPGLVQGRDGRPLHGCGGESSSEARLRGRRGQRDHSAVRI